MKRNYFTYEHNSNDCIHCSFFVAFHLFAECLVMIFHFHSLSLQQVWFNILKNTNAILYLLFENEREKSFRACDKKRQQLLLRDSVQIGTQHTFEIVTHRFDTGSNSMIMNIIIRHMCVWECYQENDLKCGFRTLYRNTISLSTLRTLLFVGAGKLRYHVNIHHHS